MPRYFFDVHDGSLIRDEIGRVLDEDEATLRSEALKVAANLMRAEAEDAEETALLLAVRDEEDHTALKVRVICQVESGHD